MTPDARPLRVWRIVRRAALILLVAALLAVAFFFPHAGNYLVVNEPLEKADAAFVLAGTRVERWLEAADLYKEGWARRIILSPGYSERAETELRTRGVRFPTETQLVTDALTQLNVPSAQIAVLPHEVDNTAQEAKALRELFAERGWKSVIVITSKYHARRARLAFRRELTGTGIRTIVRTSRHDNSTPQRWWKTRSDIRYVVSEYQKLLLYALGLRG